MAVLEVDGERNARARGDRLECRTTSSSAALPSARPIVNAKPELVVASALKPSDSSTFAEPVSHGLGMTNGSPACSARNAAPFSAVVVRGAPAA